jgi:tetratricopeptide (TPR) repeat protein
VARDANNIGRILQDQGDLPGALKYTQRALAIGEKAYGSDHPNVAIVASNIGRILQDQGNLPGALEYTKRALRILESTHGVDNPTTKNVARNMEEKLGGRCCIVRQKREAHEFVSGEVHRWNRPLLHVYCPAAAQS